VNTPAGRISEGVSTQSQDAAFQVEMRNAEDVDLHSPYNGATFYSGMVVDGKTMLEYAVDSADGVIRVILEQTPGGRDLVSGRLFARDSPISQTQAMQVLARYCERFAECARGEVTAFVCDPSRNSVWLTVELPALQRNPWVTAIRIIDPTA